MKKIFPFLLIAFFAVPQQSKGCSFYPAPFCDILSDDDGFSAVLEFTITKRLTNGIEVQIENVWYGFEPRATLTIWDREMIECNGGFNQELSQYGPVGTRIVAMLTKIDSPQSNWEIINDYRGSVFHFADSYLRLEGNRWKSHYSELDDGVDIGKGKLKDFLSDCMGVDLTPDAPASIGIAPNPASESVRIIRNWEEETQITLFDLSGREVAINWLAGEEIDFSLAGIPDGVYIVQATVGDAVFRKKLIIRK